MAPTSRDPWLVHRSWKDTRAAWVARFHAQGYLWCGRCEEQIVDLADMDVGHITPRAQARALGWTVQRCNHIDNTQPEHARCNRSEGARSRFDKNDRPLFDKYVHPNRGMSLPPSNLHTGTRSRAWLGVGETLCVCGCQDQASDPQKKAM
jgi:hypothetical protein